MFFRSFALAFLLFLAFPAAGNAFQEKVFEVKDGKVLAPRARHMPESPSDKNWYNAGWRPEREGDYCSFDASEVFNPEKGSIEIRLTVADMTALRALGNDLESLVTLYDEAGVPFFSVGINDHDVMAGSYPLHAMVMERVFGGVGFPYVAKLDGPLKEGTGFTVTVRWGTTPASNGVYINGKLVEVAVRRGPRHYGKSPGFEPDEKLSKYMNGFETWDKRKVGPARWFVVGRIGRPKSPDPFIMYPPRAVAINSVTLSDTE